MEVMVCLSVFFAMIVCLISRSSLSATTYVPFGHQPAYESCNKCPIYLIAALNPFTHSDHDEQDGVGGETVTQQETQERPKPIPAARPPPPQVDSTGKKAGEKPQVPPLPVTRPVQPQAEGSEV